MRDRRLEDCRLALLPLPLGLHARDLLAHLVEHERLVVELQRQLLRLAVKPRQLVVRLLENERRAGVVRLGLFRMLRGLAESVEPDRHLQPLQLVPQGQIFLRLFGLFAQRLDLKLEFRNFVADAQQIVLGVGQPALGLLLAVAVFRDARRLFKDLAPVGRFEGQDLIDLALPDVAVTLFAKAGVHQQLVDVAQARTLPVDEILALAGAVIPPRDGDLGRLDAELPGLIVQHERRLRVAHGCALLCAAEDDVLHLRAAQRLGTLLAEHPADGVGNIRFAAAVRADDGSDVAAELQHSLVRERFEALDLQGFQIHAYTSPFLLTSYFIKKVCKLQPEPL